MTTPSSPVQPSPGPTPGSPFWRRHGVMLLTIAAGVAVGGTLIALALTGRLGLLISAASVHPHESTAEWVGDDAVFYASLNLRPGLSALNRARDLFENVTEVGEIESSIQDGIDRLETELGLDLRGDVFPSLGPEIATAIYLPPDSSLGDFESISFIGVTDADVMDRLVMSILDYLRADGRDVTDAVVFDHPAYVVDGEWHLVPLPDRNYVLVANRLSVLGVTLDMMETPVAPLSQKDEFLAVREQLPDDRFVMAYAAPGQVARTLIDASGGNDYGFGTAPLLFSPVTSGIADQTPETVGGAISVGDRQIQVDFVMSLEGQESLTRVVNPNQVPALLPDSTIGFFNVGGLSVILDEQIGNLTEQPDVADFWEEARAEVLDAVGIDIQSDVLDVLGDEMGFGLLGGNFEPDLSDLRGLNVVAMLELSDRARADATLEKLRGLAADSGFELEHTSLNGTDAWLVPPSPDTGFLSFGYAVIDDYLVVGTSQEALQAVQDSSQSSGRSVEDTEAYRRAVDRLGNRPISTFYVAMEPLVDFIDGFIPPDEQEFFDTEVRPWMDPMESVTFAAYVDAGWARYSGLLNLDK